MLRTLEIPDPSLNLACGVWSIEDARLACEGWDDTDPSRSGIYSVRATDGKDLKRLTTTPAGVTDIPGDYSPDGQLVFKRATGDEGIGPLMLVDDGGGAPRALSTIAVDDEGRFSPDGTSVLTGAGGSIVIMDLDGKILETFTDPDAYLSGPAWSPDGTHIAFLGGERLAFADIFISLADGSDRQQVTRTPTNEIGLDWGVDPG